MSAQRERVRERGIAPAGPFAVVCVRADGRERVWNRYREQREAEQVVAALQRVGCPARIAIENELELAP